MGVAQAARPAHRAALTKLPPGTTLGPRKKTACGAGSGESAFCAIFNLYMNINVLLKARLGMERGDRLIDSNNASVQPRTQSPSAGWPTLFSSGEAPELSPVSSPPHLAPTSRRDAPWTSVP